MIFTKPANGITVILVAINAKYRNQQNVLFDLLKVGTHDGTSPCD